MPRGAQVIYPKDLGAILIAADLGPGQRVLEAGVGSGALSMTVLRAGASVVGYELREDFAERAKSNVFATLGPEASYRVEIRDVTEGIDERDLDRILLDMPEPHKVVAAAATALRPGGILLAYLPTINQTALLRAGARRRGRAVRATRDAGDHAANLAHRAAVGASRSPHGRTHGVPHDGPASELRPELVLLDEDALSGALFGGFDHGVLEVAGHGGHASRSTGLVHDGAVLFLHVGETIVQKSEDGRRDLLTQTIARAEILVDPDLHVVVSLPR